MELSQTSSIGGSRPGSPKDKGAAAAEAEAKKKAKRRKQGKGIWELEWMAEDDGLGGAQPAALAFGRSPR